MKLIRLDLENFRQFYGEQSLKLSTDSQKNVTLIYGSNGAGKTTILNAFTWGLYGETTPGLTDSEWLINNLAWSEAADGDTVCARVRISFEDKDHRYELVRTQKARKDGQSAIGLLTDGEVSLHVTDSAGQNEELGNIEGAIGSILPKRLHRFAFFDGERDIERLAQPDSTQNIEDAIKTVLGLEVFERGIAHLGKARAELNRELKEVGDIRDIEISERISRLTDELDQRELEHKDLKDNLAAQERELDRVDEELGKMKAAKELQDRRKEIESALTSARKRIQDADRGLDGKLRRSGFLAFTPDLLDTAEEQARTLQEKGEIPAPLKRPFVQSLLDNAKCICGTDLKEGSPEQEAVMTWFEKAEAPEVEARWSQIDANVQSFRTQRDDLYRYLRETIRERSGYERDEKLWEQKGSDIEQSFGEVDDETVKQTNAKRAKLRADIDDRREEIGGIRRTISNLEEERADAEAELNEAEGQSKKAATARKRISVAGEVNDIFKRVLALRTTQTREDLDDRIKQIFGDMCFRPYVPALTEDFQLTLSTLVAGDELPVAFSTGESQILALSFIGAMADLARSRYRESLEREDGSGLLSFQGGIFPLVLDAVFGSLDDTYQEGVASALPDLAPQVIVLVTRGSAVEAIEQKLWPRTGKAAVCTIYTSAADAEEASVHGPSGPIPYRIPVDDGRDRSEIVEI